MKLNLKAIRQEVKMTQKMLAFRVGITREYLSAIENNSKLPSLALLGKLAAELGVGITELLRERPAGILGNTDRRGKR